MKQTIGGGQNKVARTNARNKFYDPWVDDDVNMREQILIRT